MAGEHREHTQGVPSTAAIAGHPIHPMLVALPITTLVGALVTDLAYWGTADPFWARASLWLVGTGLATGALAAAVGLVDFWTIERARVHVDGWIHFVGNAVVLLVALGNLALRLPSPAAAILPWGLILSALTAGLLGVTGWYGGELAYRHMIGVTGHGVGQHREPPAAVPSEPRHAA